MKIELKTEESCGDPKYFNFIWSNWSIFISGVITLLIVVASTALVFVLVTFGGLWLAYTYLPEYVFLIILGVLVADLVLGIILRLLFLHR